MVTLAILAGGNATRMGGRNKALIEIDGETFIKRIYRNLSPLFDSTMIISNDLLEFSIPRASVFPDIYNNQGPLGGIHSALVNSKEPNVFIVSCDMPFADASVASKIVNAQNEGQYEIVVPEINGFLEPLFAIYSKSLTGAIEKILTESGGKSIRDLFPISKTGYVAFQDTPANARCFTNINTIRDLDSL